VTVVLIVHTTARPRRLRGPFGGEMDSLPP